MPHIIDHPPPDGRLFLRRRPNAGIRVMDNES
jgi:hypothetical protein